MRGHGGVLGTVSVEFAAHQRDLIDGELSGDTGTGQSAGATFLHPGDRDVTGEGPGVDRVPDVGGGTTNRTGQFVESADRGNDDGGTQLTHLWTDRCLRRRSGDLGQSRGGFVFLDRPEKPQRHVPLISGGPAHAVGFRAGQLGQCIEHLRRRPSGNEEARHKKNLPGVKILALSRLCTHVMPTRGPAGFDEVFRSEFPAIVRAAFLVTGDQETAKEVAQDAFAEAFARWRRVSRYDRPGAWIRRVAIRSAVRVRERDRRREELSAQTVPRPGTSEPADLSAALDALSAKQRAVVVLHYFEGLSVEETADVLDCEPSTASVHLHRARRRMADVLGETEETADAI